MQARVERPVLSKDVLEYRSAQAKSLDLSGLIFDENHNLIGRRVPFSANMADIPEDEEEERDPNATGSNDFRQTGNRLIPGTPQSEVGS